MLICQIDCFSVSAFAGDVKIEPHAASADLRAKSDVVPEVGSDFDNMQAFATDDRFRRVVIGPVDAILRQLDMRFQTRFAFGHIVAALFDVFHHDVEYGFVSPAGFVGMSLEFPVEPFLHFEM